MTIEGSLHRFNISEIIRDNSQIAKSLILIIIVSSLISLYATVVSTETTRSIVIQPLLIGVITLFTISLTVAIMGIQVASNRYSHRVDSIVIRKYAFWIHFLPHLIAILLAILMISSGIFSAFAFFVFIFFISASLLSIFSFLQWLLKTLSPEIALSTSLNQMDSDFLKRVEQDVENEKTKIMGDNDRDRSQDIFREMAYLRISNNDPVDRSIDIIRSRILTNDTGTAKSLIENYSSHITSVLDNRYQQFQTSHSDSQLVSWYLLGPFEDLFQLGLKEGNHRIAQDIIVLQRRSIQNWFEKDVDEVPEVFFRVFNSISVEYLTHCNHGQAVGIAREYAKISKVIASDIGSCRSKVTGVNGYIFVSSCMGYAERSINRGYIKSATLIRSSLRSIVDAKLRNQPSKPEREILMIGLIGEQFASEEAVSKNIVKLSNETSSRNEAKSTITTLVTFKDKIEDKNNGENGGEILEKIMSEINRVNRALEENDRVVASKVDHEEDLVLEVIRGSRMFRSPFMIEELIEEIQFTESIEHSEIQKICSELEKLDMFENREEEQYMNSNY